MTAAGAVVELGCFSRGGGEVEVRRETDRSGMRVSILMRSV
jgi:hypothetical protein